MRSLWSIGKNPVNRTDFRLTAEWSIQRIIMDITYHPLNDESVHMAAYPPHHQSIQSTQWNVTAGMRTTKRSSQFSTERVVQRMLNVAAIVQIGSSALLTERGCDSSSRLGTRLRVYNGTTIQPQLRLKNVLGVRVQDSQLCGLSSKGKLMVTNPFRTPLTA